MEERSSNAGATIIAIIVLFLLIGYGIYTRTLAPRATEDGEYSPIAYATIVKQEEGAEIPYSLDIEYPQFSGVSKDADSKLNSHISTTIQGKVAAFREEIAGRIGQGGRSSLTIRYRVFSTSYPIVSIEFTSSTYAAGATHPDYSVATINWRSDTGSTIMLSDLFAEGNDYLALLARISREKLLMHPELGGLLDEGWVERGVAATSTNFQNFVITKHGITLFFNPYQVAAYAAGVIDITLKADELAAVVNTAGPLYLLAAPKL